jgi:hypothetical protein
LLLVAVSHPGGGTAMSKPSRDTLYLLAMILMLAVTMLPGLG